MLAGRASNGLLAALRRLRVRLTVHFARRTSSERKRREQVARRLRFLKLHRESGNILVVVTHNPSLAQQAARIIHLRNSKVQSTTVPEHVPTTKPSLKATPESDGEVAVIEAGSALSGLGATFKRALIALTAWAAVVGLAILVVNYGTALYQQSQVA
jgi:energy-coupling factor transporter ATP-binding protein EcfA2